MSRPPKNDKPAIETPKAKRNKRIDPLPVKVYFKHFAANLSLGCIRTSDNVSHVYMHDSITHNYSDVSSLAELTSVAKKVFRGKDASAFLIASFKSETMAVNVLEDYLNTLNVVETTVNELIAAPEQTAA